MSEITAKCCAKVNLTLDILGRRTDGFHNLESVMQSVELYDVIRIKKIEGRGIKVTADVPGVPSGPGNTVYKACELFRNASAIDSGLAIEVQKQTPSQAGLGGGSSDAAGTLLALNKLFGEPLSMEKLSQLSAEVGSDVPFFLMGGTALVTGRGEYVSKLPDAPELNLVIVKPNFGVPTAFAYHKLAEIEGRKSAAKTALAVSAIRNGERSALITNLSNDFDLVVDTEFPGIAEIRHRMWELGSEASLLCGSGAAVFGVFSSPDEANRASKALRTKYPFAVAVKTTETAIVIGD